MLRSAAAGMHDDDDGRFSCRRMHCSSNTTVNPFPCPQPALSNAVGTLSPASNTTRHWHNIYPSPGPDTSLRLPLPMSAATASALRSALPSLVLALGNGSAAACEDAAIQLCVYASNAPADAREDVLVAMACSSELVEAVRGFRMCRSLVLCNTFFMLSCGRWADQHRVVAAVARRHRARGLSTLLYLR